MTGFSLKPISAVTGDRWLLACWRHSSAAARKRQPGHRTEPGRASCCVGWGV